MSATKAKSRRRQGSSCDEGSSHTKRSKTSSHTVAPAAVCSHPSPTPILATTGTINSQARSPLFQLPGELLYQILSFALAKDTRSEPLDLTHDNGADGEPGFLRSCRRARREGLPVFYAENDWVVKTRRVGGESGRLDPVTKRLMTYETIPRWIEAVSGERMALIRRVVVVGTRGSYVNIDGKWREGGRAAFRLEWVNNGRVGFRVEEVGVEGADGAPEGEREAFCSVQLIDLLRARMRTFGPILGGNGRWRWTRERIHDIACLL